LSNVSRQIWDVGKRRRRGVDGIVQGRRESLSGLGEVSIGAKGREKRDVRMNRLGGGRV